MNPALIQFFTDIGSIAWSDLLLAVWVLSVLAWVDLTRKGVI